MTYPDYGNYATRPVVDVPGPHRARSGAELWEDVERLARERSPLPCVVIDCYPGVDLADLIASVRTRWPDRRVVDVEESAALPGAVIDDRIAGHLTDDRVFGVLGHQSVTDFYDPARLDLVRAEIGDRDRPLVVLGWGAALVAPAEAVVVLADLPRWEIQQRHRRGGTNWRCDNADEDVLRKYKRGYFVEWRAADRHKHRTVFARLDFVLDTTHLVRRATMISGAAFRAGLAQAVRQPFRVVPFFDPGVWGGQWMAEVVGLPESEQPYAWCFDGVPEEQSLLLGVDGAVVEIPAIDLVLTHPQPLLGELTYARFGAEFPIRFDLLDTMQGGNLSLQVHPSTAYIQDRFGMAYTQDESYYLLDAGPQAKVYLGLRDETDPAEMMAALRRAESGGEAFPAEDYVNTFPVRRHDHVSIPAGTVHCSGADSMVLEISATPYIFTFKMWDWGRTGLDGRPRPVHLDHAEHNVVWGRRTDWVREELLDRVERVAEGDGWHEERTGLHRLEFIEVRRTWFTRPAGHDTCGTVTVLNLVEGEAAVLESPTGAFPPFTVHYAETVILPAQLGAFTVRPRTADPERPLALLRAFVRGTAGPGPGDSGRT